MTKTGEHPIQDKEGRRACTHPAGCQHCGWCEYTSTVIMMKFPDEHEREIINPEDFDTWRNVYLVSLSPYDFGRIVFADNESEAVDAVYDYEEAINGKHFFLDESDIEPEDEDVLRAGNHSLALPSHDVTSKQLASDWKKAIVDHIKEIEKSEATTGSL